MNFQFWTRKTRFGYCCIVLEYIWINGESESVLILNLLPDEVWGETFENYELLMETGSRTKDVFP